MIYSRNLSNKGYLKVSTKLSLIQDNGKRALRIKLIPLEMICNSHNTQ